MGGRTDARAQFEALTQDTAEVIPREDLLAKLQRSIETGQPLRVKLGIDPSRPDLTLGHSVVLRRLRRFQDLGHTAVLIIGNFTGRVGDPSGASETRPFLTQEQIEANARTYLDQARLILDMERAEIHGNAEWLEPLTMAAVLRLTSSSTVAQMLEREDFRTRYGEGRSISVVEFLYPLMQAYDSVAIRSDVEMGGSDQLFNLLVGRHIQREYGQEPQVVFTMPLILGTDGVRKMSKSFGNYVALTEPPEEMFGKLMSIPDALTEPYMRLTTDEAFDPGEHPNAAKRRMARAVVALYHGEAAAEAAELRFDQVHRDREIPPDVPEVPLPPALAGLDRVWLPRLLAELGLVESNSEGRRQVEQGGVRIDGLQVDDPAVEVELASLRGKVIQVGRRRFVRI